MIVDATTEPLMETRRMPWYVAGEKRVPMNKNAAIRPTSTRKATRLDREATRGQALPSPPLSREAK